MRFLGRGFGEEGLGMNALAGAVGGVEFNEIKRVEGRARAD